MKPLPQTIQQDILTQYEPLVHHVLKRCFIDPRSNDYEDLAQIARMALLEAAHQTKANPLSPLKEDRNRFITFARSRMIWAVNDELRRLVRHEQRETAVDDFPTQMAQGECLEEALHWGDMWRKILPHLTTMQLNLLYLLLDESLTHAERANQLGLSRKSYYKHKNQLATRLKKFLLF